MIKNRDDAALIQGIDLSGLDTDRIVDLSEDPGRVCSELRKRYAAGLSTLPVDIKDDDPTLLLAMFDTFGSADAALAKAGVPRVGAQEPAEAPATPQPERRSTTPTQEKVRPAPAPAPAPAAPVQAVAPSPSRPAPEPYQAPLNIPATPAVAATFPIADLPVEGEPVVLGRRVKSRELLIQAVEELTAEPWDREQIIAFRRKWGPSVKAHFGDWIAASRVLGVPEWQFSAERVDYLAGNVDLVLDLLRDRHEAGEQVDAATIFHEDRELWEAAKRLYGSFTSCMKALNLG